MHRLNLEAKNTERRAGLHFAPIHEKLNYPKRFTDNIEQKITDDLFLIKNYSRFGAAAVSPFHGIFHGNLPSLFSC